MSNRMIAFLMAALTLTVAGCETVHTTDGGAVGVDRTQRMMISAEQINTAAAQSYQQTMEEAAGKGLLNRDVNQLNRVRAVANRLIPAAGVFRADSLKWRWEVNVISSKEVNAWCMPGGKMAVYSGLIDTLQLTDAELAAVMGHEIAHALREHGREKASQQQAQNMVIGVGAALLGVGQGGASLANLAAQVTYGLPNSREFEREADRIGVELAARAGYDPRASITLWQKMAQASGGGGAPGFMSTHPTAADRIQDLQKYSAAVMPLYQASPRK
jgi:predicted Zn-dependent protease